VRWRVAQNLFCARRLSLKQLTEARFSPTNGAEAVIPNNPSRARKYPLDKYLYAQRHLIE